MLTDTPAVMDEPTPLDFLGGPVVTQLDDQGGRVAYLRFGQGQIVDSWPSFEALQRALPAGQVLHRLPDGRAYREKRVRMGEQVEDEQGRLFIQSRRVRRQVVLSLREAQQNRLKGIESDHFNGQTWMLNGVKPERDLAVMLARPVAEDIELIPAPPTEVAQAKARKAAEEAQAKTGVAPLSALPGVSVPEPDDEQHDEPRRGPGRPRKEA